jgi:hypothetical protein
MKKIHGLYALLVFVGGMAGGVLSGGLWHGPGAAMASAPPQRSVAATEFVLLDSAGKARARISVDKDGQTTFSICDRASHPRAQVLVDSLGAPSITLYDTENRVRLVLKVGTDGIPTVGLSDQNSELRAILGVDGDGEPGLNFYAKGGKLMRELP